ncbi:unnamed protein product [Brassica oleracea var. botrytis]
MSSSLYYPQIQTRCHNIELRKTGMSNDWQSLCLNAAMGICVRNSCCSRLLFITFLCALTIVNDALSPDGEALVSFRSGVSKSDGVITDMKCYIHPLSLKCLTNVVGTQVCGASGIGAEAARLFTEHGARVVITDVKDELGRNVTVSIGEDKVSYFHCDVRKETEVESPVKFTVEKHGRIDVLFSNAGVPEPLLDIRDLNLEAFDRSQRSCAVWVATPLVCEGYKIKMEASELEEIFSEAANLKGIVLKARHVAEAALFLASDDSAYVSGHNLLVDGGFSVIKN